MHTSDYVYPPKGDEEVKRRVGTNRPNDSDGTADVLARSPSRAHTASAHCKPRVAKLECASRLGRLCNLSHEDALMSNSLFSRRADDRARSPSLRARRRSRSRSPDVDDLCHQLDTCYPDLPDLIEYVPDAVRESGQPVHSSLSLAQSTSNIPAVGDQLEVRSDLCQDRSARCASED